MLENQLTQLETEWSSQFMNVLASENDILSFQLKYNILIPNDLKVFFLRLNGTNGKYDGRFFEFFSLKEFQNIDEKLKNKDGSPDYSNIVNTFDGYKTTFVFANFDFYLFSYAIRLYEDKTSNNEVYVLCGDEYGKVANSFTEFVDLYLNNLEKLLF